MHRDVVGPQGRHLDRPGHGVGHGDQVHGDLGAVILAGLDALGNGGVGGGPQDVDDLGPGLGRHLHFGAPGVHDLHVGHDDLAGKKPFQLPHRVQAFALDQRGAGLDPIHPGGHGQLGHVDGPVQIHKVQRKLQNWRHMLLFLSDFLGIRH